MPKNYIILSSLFLAPISQASNAWQAPATDALVFNPDSNSIALFVLIYLMGVAVSFFMMGIHWAIGTAIDNITGNKTYLVNLKKIHPSWWHWDHMETKHFDLYLFLSWIFIPIGLYRIIKSLALPFKSIAIKEPDSYSKYMYALKTNRNMSPEMVAVYRWGCSKYEGIEIGSLTNYLKSIKEDLTNDGKDFEPYIALHNLKILSLISEEEEKSLSDYFEKLFD